jgi:hypothetical protein
VSETASYLIRPIKGKTMDDVILPYLILEVWAVGPMRAVIRGFVAQGGKTQGYHLQVLRRTRKSRKL